LYHLRVNFVLLSQLASTEEFIDGAFAGSLGEVLIRCNNVMYLRGVPEEEGAKDDEMVPEPETS
jgi:small nuclear ribonucleoprotein F